MQKKLLSPVVWLLTAGSALAQAPTITGVVPVVNARTASRTGTLTVSFDQTLTTGASAGLQVYSAQRGGLRTGHSGSTAATGSTLRFAPTAYPFAPGETVQYTLTTAVAGSGGPLAQARVGQFTTAVAPSSASFAGTAQATRNRTGGVALGDVDGDGDLDILTADYFNGTVSVLLNNGNGNAFVLAPVVPVGNSPMAVHLGDVDGDGDLDLLTANLRTTGTVSVRLNDGSGTFGGGADVAVGSTPYDLALGDVDGDGDLDFVTANNRNGTVTVTGTASVRLNDGSGSFGGGSEVLVGYYSNAGPKGVALGDVDGDGDLDLLVASGDGGTVSVRRNTGNGTFGTGQDILGLSGSVQLVLGDVDGDGDLDFLTASSGNGGVSVRLNNGAGSFSGNQTVQVPFSVSLALGDVDGDGDLDVVSTNAANNIASFRLNNGSGIFGTGQDIPVGPNPFGCALGDLDGDVDLDAVIGSSLSTSSRVLLNSGTALAAMAGAAAAPAFALWPNPARAVVQVSGAAGTVAVLRDALGREVLRQPLTLSAATLDPCGLPAGLYAVQCGGATRRLVIE